MPIDFSGQEANLPNDAPPNASNAGQDPPPLPLPGQPGFTGPAGPSQAPVLTGKARLDDLIVRMQYVFGMRAEDEKNLSYNNDDFYRWVLTLQDDPMDPEYSRLVAAEKAHAREMLGDRAPSASGVAGPGPSGFSASGDRAKPPVALPPDPTVEGHRRRVENELYIQPELLESKQTRFKGRQIDDSEIIDQGGVSSNQQDQYLQQFLENEGIQLTGTHKLNALKTGNYVYAGKETDEHFGTQHDVYMYEQDAKFALVDLGPTQIAAYQKALGLPATGRTDPDVQKMWNYAVDQARAYAARGQKVTVKELMDIYVASAAAESAKRGSGGAGSTPLEDFDYYRIMQQILGDTSGVPNAQT